MIEEMRERSAEEVRTAQSRAFENAPLDLPAFFAPFFGETTTRLVDRKNDARRPATNLNLY